MRGAQAGQQGYAQGQGAADVQARAGSRREGGVRVRGGAQPMITEALQDATRESSREERGQALFEERYNEVEHAVGDEWYVPASALLNGRYVVRLRETPSCECADHTYRGSKCKHIICASIAQAKSRTCSCCSRRVLGRFTEEVSEEDELLSFYPGEALCERCIKEGYWV